MLTKAKIIKYVGIGVIAVIIASIWSIHREDKTPRIVKHRDYDEIKASDTLKAVTEYNSISFYLDKNNITGFHYELIEAFARSKGLKVGITPEMSFEKRINDLNSGVYDIIAFGIPATSEWKDSISLTVPIIRSKQILVQRKPGYGSTSTYITSQLDLAHKTLHIEKGSPSVLRIRNLEAEIADTIFINEVEKYGPEQLLAMVAHGDIDYAVADESVAKASIDSFPQLDINTGIGFSQFYSWGVSKQSPALLDSLNTWLTGYLTKGEYKELYRKYFRTNP